MHVEEVVGEGPGVVSIVIGGRHLDELRAEAGQFFRVRLLTRDLWWASNPYSLSAAVQPHRMRSRISAGTAPPWLGWSAASGSSPRARTGR